MRKNPMIKRVNGWSKKTKIFIPKTLKNKNIIENTPTTTQTPQSHHHHHHHHTLINQDSELLPGLPNDIVLEILSRLPIKALSQCRFVCKSWLYTITSSGFTKIHANKSIQQDNSHVASLMLIQPTSIDPNIPCDCDIYLLEYDNCDKNFDVGSHLVIDDLDVTYVKTQFNRRIHALQIVGSCNGLLCLSDNCTNQPVYVVNPITGDYVTLPAALDCMQMTILLPGFGYDCVKDEYKVVKFSCRYNFAEKEFQSILYHLTGEVCTVGTDAWRRIGDVDISVFSGKSCPVFVDATLHWMVNDFNHQEIVTLDVGKEVFSVLPVPKTLKNGQNRTSSSRYDLHLAVLGGRLCIYMYNENSYVIWVMKDYGVIESWTQQYVVEGLYYVRPLSLIRNEEVLVLYDDYALMLYDTLEKSVQVIKIQGISRSFYVYPHVGSLVSPRISAGLTSHMQ